jgi:hypothetical protein
MSDTPDQSHYIEVAQGDVSSTQLIANIWPILRQIFFFLILNFFYKRDIMQLFSAGTTTFL